MGVVAPLRLHRHGGPSGRAAQACRPCLATLAHPQGQVRQRDPSVPSSPSRRPGRVRQADPATQRARAARVAQTDLTCPAHQGGPSVQRRQDPVGPARLKARAGPSNPAVRRALREGETGVNVANLDGRGGHQRHHARVDRLVRHGHFDLKAKQREVKTNLGALGGLPAQEGLSRPEGPADPLEFE